MTILGLKQRLKHNEGKRFFMHVVNNPSGVVTVAYGCGEVRGAMGCNHSFTDLNIHRVLLGKGKFNEFLKIMIIQLRVCK